MKHFSFAEVAEEVGIEEIAKPSQDEIAGKLMQAAVAGFSDGDIVAIHTDRFTGCDAELYGEYSFNDGRVARLLSRAAIEANPMEETAIHSLQEFAAEYVSLEGNPFEHANHQSVVKILPDRLELEGCPVPLPRPPETVIEYSACLSSRSLPGNQIAFLDYHNRPFRYMALARSRFMNNALMRAYDSSRFGAGTASLFIQRGLYYGNEDGNDLATAGLIQGQKSHGAPTEVADVILAVSSQHTTQLELERAVSRSHMLMKEGGVLVLRGLVFPGPDELGIDDLKGWAFASGFDEQRAVHIPTILRRTASILTRGHDNDREMEMVVLTK